MSDAQLARLDAAEVAQLNRLEDRINDGITSFIDVGDALSKIRDSRLYRGTHGTFEDYCRQKWNLNKRYCDRLIQSVEVVKDLGPMGPTITSERQARELSRVEPERRQEVVEKAMEMTGGKITAAALKEAAKPAPVAFEPVVEMPTQRRRPRSEFILSDWQNHARTVLRMTLDSVPATDKRAAINFLSKLISEL